jgi:hypothetical protein
MVKRLENMVEAAELSSKDEELHWSKFLRLWAMMEALVIQGSVSRTDLVTTTFSEHYSELDLYERQNIVCYHQYTTQLQPFRSQLLEPEKIATPSPGVNSSSLETPFRDLENIVVCPGSPRMRAAFERILQDPRIIRLKQLVEKKLKKRKLKSARKDTQEELVTVAQVRRDLIREHEVAVNSYALVQLICQFLSYVQCMLMFGVFCLLV